jgi:quercetin dioxygenase-like cupin family protein
MLGFEPSLFERAVDTMHESLLNLVRAISIQLESSGTKDEEVRAELERLKDACKSAVPRNSFAVAAGRDYSAILEAVIAGGSHEKWAAVALALGVVQGCLPWAYHYECRVGEEELASRIAFAELIGPDGPLNASAIRVGFTLIAPHTLYPEHVHPAVELYCVISGRAQWISERCEQIAPPGRLLLHRSNERHAMRTFDQPLLALWSWSGEIDTPAFYV